MSLFKDLISSIEPTASNTAPAPSPVSRLASASPKPAQRPTPRANGAAEMPGLKRKASGPVDTSQVKMQKKDPTPQSGQTNGALRTAPPAGVAKPSSAAASASVPYRGTAGLGGSKPGIAPVKKTNPQGSTLASVPKAAVPAPRPTTLKSTGSMSGSAVSKPTSVTSGSAAAASQKKTGGYMAMLQKAKEKDQTKPPAPPIKHEPTKILTKKDRERIRLEAKAAGKAKKPGVSAPAKSTDGKVDASKEKRKPADLGYQGTARPAKKPVEVGYKGTAKPMAGSAPAGRPGAAAAKSKQKLSQGRYSGYAEWSDLDEMDDEEEDYESDASSDMEGGFYDVEDEEQMALKMAKKEDAEALAEEMAHKREKEERKRKLAALAKGAAAKRRY